MASLASVSSPRFRTSTSFARSYGRGFQTVSRHCCFPSASCRPAVLLSGSSLRLLRPLARRADQQLKTRCPRRCRVPDFRRHFMRQLRVGPLRSVRYAACLPLLAFASSALSAPSNLRTVPFARQTRCQVSDLSIAISCEAGFVRSSANLR